MKRAASRPAAVAAGAAVPVNAVPVTELLLTAGFDTPAAMKAARRALEGAKLTRAGKTGMAGYKREAALALLAKTFVTVCGAECRALAPRGRTPAISGTRCEVCGGSNNRRAALGAARALRANGVTRVLIVGGKGAQQREIAEVFGEHGIALQGIDGTQASHSQRDAQANMRRAQVLVIWGSTELRHAVSNLYTSEPPEHLRVVRVSRRGIEALCNEITRSFVLARRHGG
jgi:hypothetical protein